MDIIEKIGKATSDTCRITVNKTSKMAQRARLKMYINECKNQIDEEYTSIGKKVYEKHVREENIDISKDLRMECAKIDELSKKIDNAIKDILMLKDMKKCNNCYEEISISYNFCPRCGQKQNTNIKKEKIIEEFNTEDISKSNQNEIGIVIEDDSDEGI